MSWIGRQNLNGIIAAAFWTSVILTPSGSLSDKFEIRERIPQRSFHVSNVQFQKEDVGSEFGVSYSAGQSYGPLQPVFYASLTDEKAAWVGAGFTNTVSMNEDWYLALTFIPGVYHAGNDEDLGGWLMFRSGIEVGYSITEDWQVGLVYDHRSSGDLWLYNPGMETLQIKIGRLLRAN